MSEAWAALGDAMAAAQAESAAAAPDPETAAEGEAYLVRVLTASLADAFLGNLLTADGLTRPLPVRGGPNPDYLMSHAGIDPARRYRIEGRINGSERVGVGLYGIGEGGASLLEAYAAVDRSSVGPDGGFALDIAADARGPGTLAITPACRVLLVRVLHRDAAAQPAGLRLLGGARKPALGVTTGSSEGGIAHAGRGMLASVRQFLQWSAEIGAAPNRFTTPPASLGATVQGDPDTCYQLGYYDLRAGEWLEVLMPPGLGGYWSVHGYNHWCEPLPGAGMDDRRAVADADGRIRLAIGPEAPLARANRIDTQGRRRGVLIARTIGSVPAGLPEARIQQGE